VAAEVLQQEDRLDRHAAQVAEHGRRLAQRVVRRALGPADEPLRDRPLEDGHRELAGQGLHELLDALLLRSLDRDDGVKRADQALQVVGARGEGHARVASERRARRLTAAGTALGERGRAPRPGADYPVS
jgi:hypothetical protein